MISQRLAWASSTDLAACKCTGDAKQIATRLESCGGWELRGLAALTQPKLRMQDLGTWRSAHMRRFVRAISCCRGVMLRPSSFV